MTLILCLDSKSGLLFHGRRQSRDRVLRDDILQETVGSRLWMTPYSYKQFSPAPHILVSDDFRSQAQPGDYCFAEGPVPPTVQPERLLLYRWNRTYPADCFLPFSPQEQGFRLVRSSEFPGHSHEKITKEVYEK